MRFWAASMTAFIPEAQALFTVVASVESCKPDIKYSHILSFSDATGQLKNVHCYLNNGTKVSCMVNGFIVIIVVVIIIIIIIVIVYIYIAQLHI